MRARTHARTHACTRSCPCGDTQAQVALKEVAVARKKYADGQALQYDEMADRIVKLPWQLVLRFRDHAHACVKLSVSFCVFVFLTVSVHTVPGTWVAATDTCARAHANTHTHTHEFTRTHVHTHTDAGAASIRCAQHRGAAVHKNLHRPVNSNLLCLRLSFPRSIDVAFQLNACSPSSINDPSSLCHFSHVRARAMPNSAKSLRGTVKPASSHLAGNHGVMPTRCSQSLSHADALQPNMEQSSACCATWTDSAGCMLAMSKSRNDSLFVIRT